VNLPIAGNRKGRSDMTPDEFIDYLVAEVTAGRISMDEAAEMSRHFVRAQVRANIGFRISLRQTRPRGQ